VNRIFCPIQEAVAIINKKARRKHPCVYFIVAAVFTAFRWLCRVLMTLFLLAFVNSAASRGTQSKRRRLSVTVCHLLIDMRWPKHDPDLPVFAAASELQRLRRPGGPENPLFFSP